MSNAVIQIPPDEMEKGKLYETDVRLMRRVLVCLNTGELESAGVIINYLREVRKLRFQLPGEGDPDMRARQLMRLSPNEIWLAQTYQSIQMMKPYTDTIFLNSKWANPKTMFVRLNQEVPALGALGQVYYLPKAGEFWLDSVESMHADYMSRVPQLKREEGEPQVNFLKRAFAKLFS